jgi:hypothetical protein
MKKNFLRTLPMVALLLSAQNVLAQTTAEETNTTDNYPMTATASHVWNFADPALVQGFSGGFATQNAAATPKTFDGLYVGGNTSTQFFYLLYYTNYGEIESGTTSKHATSLQDGSEENKQDMTGLFSFVIPSGKAGRLSYKVYAAKPGTTAMRCRVGSTLLDAVTSTYNWCNGCMPIAAQSTNTSVYYGKVNDGSDALKCYSLAWVPEGSENLKVTIDNTNVTTYTPNVNVKIPAGLKAYYLSGASSTSMTPKEITNGVIPALTGVILVSTESLTTAKEYTFTMADNGILGINDASNKNYLIGTSENTTLQSSATTGDGTQTYYTLGINEEGTVGMAKVSSTTAVTQPKYSAFVAIPNSATADLSKYSDFISLGLQITTGINEVNSGAQGTTDAAYYNMQGMKVINPAKGLYIHQGKKVLLGE